MQKIAEMLASDIFKYSMLKLAASIPNPTGGKATGSKIQLPKVAPVMTPPINDIVPKLTTANATVTPQIQGVPNANTSGTPMPTLPMF